MTVRAVWFECPGGHQIIGFAYDESTEPDEAAFILTKTVRLFIAKRTINPWCELCKGARKDWRLVDVATDYNDLAAAARDINKIQAEIRKRGLRGRNN